MRFRIKLTFQVITKLVFKIATKHLFLSSAPQFSVGWPVPPLATATVNLHLAHRHNLHAPQYLCQLNPAAIDSRFNCSFRYLQKRYDLLITQLLDVAKNDAGAEIR